ncbi:HET-domain-containing protein [Corynespora cassiicola Philippines]|uniref:HET-domain-containing protein n=1 Tax=Corynespora cassiicola Philippines TaxID=1448308 RepID=A0A2T2NHY0_CORCC|nr:HET-domain-containing protein [Corynespora cassiicola Philippines]
MSRFNHTQPFCYASIEHGGDFIRLLTLLPGHPQEPVRCRLQSACLNDQPFYETVSYAWGNPALNHSITVNDRSLNITENLYTALVHLRRCDRSLTLWVDAVCIDQSNITERSRQVAKMRRIYRGCSRVYVWLGVPLLAKNAQDAHEELRLERIDSGIECEDTQRSFTPIQEEPQPMNPFALAHHFYEDKHFHELPGMGKDDNGNLRVADETPFLKMYEFLAVPWWSRLWCVQEILLAPDALVVYGSYSVPWDTLRVANMNSRRHYLSCCHLTQTVLSWRVRDDDVLEKAQSEHYQDLDRLLRMYGHRKCQEPRDKVFGMIGLVSNDQYPALIPDYTRDMEDVFYDTTVSIHQQRPDDLRFLTGYRKRELNHLPSWVRDYSHTPDMVISWVEKHRLDLYELYDASAGIPPKPVRIDGMQMHLTGTRIGTIQTTSEPRKTLVTHDAVEMVKNWLQLAGLKVPTTMEELDTPRQREFWRTIHADACLNSSQSYSWRRCTEADIDAYLATVAVLFNIPFTSSTDQTGSSIQVTMAAKGTPEGIQTLSKITTLGKALFFTEGGKFGLGYEYVRPGDEIWALSGGNVPFVLRKDEGGRGFEIIGDAYIEGGMDGVHGGVSDVVLV